MSFEAYAKRAKGKAERIIRKQPNINTAEFPVDMRVMVCECYNKRHERLKVYIPPFKKYGNENLPVIIDIHGGGFVAGQEGQNENLGIWFAKHGYLTFIPEYRPVPETNIFGQMEDIIQCLSYIGSQYINNYGGDRRKVYLVGDNDGAMLACLIYATIWNPISMVHIDDELSRDIPNSAKLMFRAIGLQSGIFSLNSGNTGKYSNFIVEPGWRKHSYAKYLSPATYTSLLPPCFLITSLTDSQKSDTKKFSKYLSRKNKEHQLYTSGNIFAVNDFAALHPEKAFSEEANLKMLEFFRQYE